MATVNYSFGTLADECTVMVGDDDPVSVDIDLNGDKAHFVIRFIPTPNPENPEFKLTWTNRDGTVYLTFFDWNNQLGTTTISTRAQIGQTNAGNPIFILVSHYKLAKLNVLHIQFVLGFPLEVQP